MFPSVGGLNAERDYRSEGGAFHALKDLFYRELACASPLHRDTKFAGQGPKKMKKEDFTGQYSA